MRAHRKKQRVHETAADEEAQVSEGAGTALATQSTGAAPLFGRMVGSNNAKLFLGCVKNALEDPLPFSRFTDYPDMGVKQQRDMLFHCKQRVPSRYFVSLSIYSPLFFTFTAYCSAGIRGARAWAQDLGRAAEGR